MIKNIFKKIILPLLVVLLVIATGIAVYSSWELHKIKSPKYQQQMADQQAKQIVSSVGKIFQLPKDTPQIATVSDAESLKKSQPFFESAKNGDVVLIFTDEAILYRQSENKVINVGPISREKTPASAGKVEQSPAAPSGKTTETEPTIKK